MESTRLLELFEPFTHLSDPRCSNARHHLFDLFVIALCAVISGAEGWEDIEDYGHAQADWFCRFLALPHGIPSHDTFGRVFARLHPDELTQCFICWTDALRERSDGELVSLDGKTLRHSFDQAASKAAIHMVSAWAGANRLVLGQVKVDDKSNEITAIPELLALLDLEGATVTIDAMGCQTEIAKCIVAQGADYVLALKENHKTLYENVSLLFNDIAQGTLDDVISEQVETVDGDHGRIETRRYWLTADIECLGLKASWAGIQSVGMVESQREVGHKVSIERRYYLTSLPCEASRFARAVRGHWGVENGLHWVLDMSFGEDACRIRKGYGAQNLAVLRHMAINLLGRDRQAKRGIKARRKRAGWNRSYLMQILMG